MTENEKKLAAELLDMASDEFSNHGCNDMDESVYEGWTLEERRKFVKEFWAWNGSPEEYDKNRLHIGDSSLMAFMSHKLLSDE